MRGRAPLPVACLAAGVHRLVAGCGHLESGHLKVPPVTVTSPRSLHVIVLCALLGVLVLAACSGPSEPTKNAANDVGDVSAAPSMATIVRPTMTDQPTDVTGTLDDDDDDDEGGEADVPTDDGPAELDMDNLVAEVDRLVSDKPGFIEVVLATPDGGAFYTTNASEPLEAASLYKLAVMVEVFHQRDAGLLSFDDEIVIDAGFLSEGSDAISEADIGTGISIDTLLFNMIDLSSNVAATALLWRVGTDSVNTTMQELGLSSTQIRWYPLAYGEESGDVSDGSGDAPAEDEDSAPGDSVSGGEDGATEEPESEPEPESSVGRVQLLSAPPVGRILPDLRADLSNNVTSAEDVAALLGMLERGEAVSPESSAEMLNLLRGQVLNDRLPAYLPDDAVVAHKTGNLDGLSHDAGIIYTPAGPIIVVVMTEDLDDETANAIMAQIGLSVWQHAGG